MAFSQAGMTATRHHSRVEDGRESVIFERIEKLPALL
jgi:hypothetical protein